MSAPELASAPAPEATIAATSEPTPVPPTEVADPAVQVGATALDVTSPEPALPETTDAGLDAEPKTIEPVKMEEDKKDKKHGRKPFADLLNKIRKPLEKPAHSEKKAETDTPAAEEAVPPTTLAPSADAVARETAVAESEAVAETQVAEDAAKDVTTPRKERGNNFLDKITAFVLKPKSPKGRKSEVYPEAEESKAVDIPAAEPTVPQVPAESADPVEAEVAAPDTTEVSEAIVPTDAAPLVEPTVEEIKTEKKEKTPKDIATKLARRLSARMFGGEKKEKNVKKTEPTQEEPEESAEVEAPAATVSGLSSSAPQIPAQTSEQQAAETPTPASESAPVIAAAA